MSDQTTEKSWFSLLFGEYSERGEAMFAFSRSQVEEVVPWETFQREWVSVGDSGLQVKRSVRAEFVRRMDAAFDGWQAGLPELRVRFIGTDHWDRPTYQDERGRRLVDVNLSPPNEALELHTVTTEGEPIGALEVRPVYLTEAADGGQS